MEDEEQWMRSGASEGDGRRARRLRGCLGRSRERVLSQSRGRRNVRKSDEEEIPEEGMGSI